MLFDLTGRGRRRVVKVIYLGLAVLLGGGLVFLGIGGNTSGGGLLDAFKDQAETASEQTQERRDNAAEATQTDPRNPVVWARLADTEYQLAGQTEGFNAQTGEFAGKSRTHLEAAKRAWERHLALAGEKPDAGVAAKMVNAFIGLEDTEAAVAAQEVVLESRGDQAGYGDYARLASLAYTAGQTRKADLAAERAIELAPSKDQKDALKQSFDQAKAQAGGQATPPTTTGATTTP